MSEKAAGVFMGVCLILTLVVAFLVAEQRDDLKKQAVEHGYAEWVVKPDGSTTWQWKEAAK